MSESPKRRVKTYSTESGYSVQYMSESTEPTNLGFVFWISTDGSNFRRILVTPFALTEVLKRPPRPPETYGIAKLRLLEFFDLEFRPSAQPETYPTLLITPEQASRYAEVLGLQG